MSRDEDRTLYADIFEPFDRAINSNSKIKPPIATKLFTEETINELLNRSSSFSENQTQTPKRKRLNSESSNASPAVSSPWELKRLKGELIEAKSQINRLELRIDHQRSIGKEMTVLFENEKQALVSQQKRDQKTISQLEDRLKVIRERESDVKEKLVEVMQQLNECRSEYDMRVQQLQRENSALKDKIIEINSNNGGQISEMRRDMDELSQALESTQNEATALRNELNQKIAVASEITSLQVKLDKQGFELSTVNNRVKELEHERESYKDWLLQAKVAQKRLAAMPDLEKQLAKMKKEESHLRDIARGKLLMEEKINTLKQQVASLEPAQKELHEIQVKYAALEAALLEWQEVVSCVHPSSGEVDDSEVWKKMNGGAGARLVKSALEKAQQTQLTSINDKMEAESKVVQMKNELSTIKHEWEKTKMKLADLEKLQQSQKGLVHRLQKRLSLVARERDSYRNQIDSYEKELTVTITGEGQSGNPLQARVDGLEKTLQGYRELLDKMEQDTVGPDINATPALRDQLARLRDEVETLRRDKEMLSTRKDQLELQLEYRALKGDYDPTKFKILHMTNNPANAAQSLARSDLEKAEAEIKRLRQRIQKLEVEGADMSQRLSETLIEGGNSKELQQLRQEVEGNRIKLQRMKEVFTTSTKEFRDVCFLLLGYKIDKVGQLYRLTSMYAESTDEYLNFTLTDGVIEMVQTNYLMTIGELVELHLHHHRSLPLFLSALTQALFDKTAAAEKEE